MVGLGQTDKLRERRDFCQTYIGIGCVHLWTGMDAVCSVAFDRVPKADSNLVLGKHELLWSNILGEYDGWVPRLHMFTAQRHGKSGDNPD